MNDQYNAQYLWDIIDKIHSYGMRIRDEYLLRITTHAMRTISRPPQVYCELCSHEHRDDGYCSNPDCRLFDNRIEDLLEEEI
jgi:hypothetical protein